CSLLCCLTGRPAPGVYTLSLHDALPILVAILTGAGAGAAVGAVAGGLVGALIDLGVPEADAHRYAEGVRAGGTLLAVTTDDSRVDRKSTRLNSSHVKISYAVFCLKKKRK